MHLLIHVPAKMIPNFSEALARNYPGQNDGGTVTDVRPDRGTAGATSRNIDLVVVCGLKPSAAPYERHLRSAPPALLITWSISWSNQDFVFHCLDPLSVHYDTFGRRLLTADHNVKLDVV